jgi:hypothetical protein
MSEQFSYNLELERQNNFQRLREQTHKEIDAEIEKRISENPNPTEEEIMAGAFREMIEPQVRDALFEFYRKGYSTESSGFGGKYGEIQAIDGYFEIDEQIKRGIEALDAKVLKGKDIGLPGQSESYTYIQFYPQEPDLNKIKEKWDAIAALLPQREKPAQPSISGGSEDFRKQYASNRTDIEKVMLQKRLALEEPSPEVEKDMKKRLEELSK